MSMKPCPYEQDVLLSLHGEVSLGVRIRAGIHAWHCPSCRERRRDYTRLGATLMSLRPGFAMPSRPPGGSRYSLRLSLVAAVLALAVAALSFYVVKDQLIAPASAASYAASPPNDGESAARDCATPAAAAPPPEKVKLRRGGPPPSEKDRMARKAG